MTSPNKELSNGSKTASRVATRGTKKTRKKKRPVLKTFLFLILFAIIGTFVYAYFLLDKGSDLINAVSIVDSVDEQGNKITIPVEESVKEKPVSLLILGIDQRSGAGGLNTDVIMVATLNPNTKKGAVVAMPRDTKITYDGRSRKANAFYANEYTKAQKSGSDKIQAMIEAKSTMKKIFGEFYDIPIQYAISANFKGFEEVVDLFGGVEVNVDMRMKYTDSHDGTNIDLEPGWQTLSGQKALDFVRFRQTNTNPNASSDFERNMRQTEVIKALLKKMISFGGVTKLSSAMTTISDDVHTDMPSEEILRLLSTYYNIDVDNITMMSLQGSWKSPYVVPNEDSLDEAKQLLQSILAE